MQTAIGPISEHRDEAITDGRVMRFASDVMLAGHVLCLDAVAVALVWQQTLGRVAGVSPNGAERGVLAAVVACIYLLDRQLDAAKLRSLCNATARHAAHRRFALLLRPLIVVTFVVALTLLPRLDRSVLIGGAGLALFTLLHLSIVQLAPRRLAGGRKELSVGLIFAAGCALHALARKPDDVIVWLATGVTGLLFAFNCLCLGTWEAERDAAQGLPDLKSVPGLSTQDLPQYAGWLMCLGLLWAVAANRLAGASIASAALLLIGLNRLADRNDSTTIRVAADLALLTPLLWMTAF